MAEVNPDIAGLTALVQQLLAKRELDRRERDQVALELERARQAAGPVTSVIQPTLPKIGGISNGVVWVGGEPNVSWTETKNLEPRSACHGIHQGDMSLQQVTPNMGNGSVNQSKEHGGTVAFMSALLHDTMYSRCDQGYPLSEDAGAEYKNED
jgi:hypothetical protein